MEAKKKSLCKRCLLREMAEADIQMIEKYKSAIKNEDKVSEEIYENRLTICKDRLLKEGYII